MKVFNLISRTNETRHIKWHETCKCKELILKVYVTKDLVGIQVIVSECECDKSCDLGEYLDHSNFKCRKKLFH